MPEDEDTIHDEDTFREYANNVNLDSSVWDLTLVFGQLNPRTIANPSEPVSVNWHTAMTLPWATAKLLSYYLKLNILFQEAAMGEIIIPKALIPLVPKADANETKEDTLKLFDKLKSFHAGEFKVNNED